ncbi:MAG: glycosyltransferase, partial [Pirellulaceae bacterium]|nr:glycosyltransferase [Pirellulaceae bacterium]
IATIAGIQQALKQSPKWVGTMDADLSHRPEDLARLWNAAVTDSSDVLIGSRYVDGGRIDNWSLPRRIASRLVNGFARWVLWLPTRDNSSALRMYRAKTLREIELSAIDCRGYAYLEQILLHLRRVKARMHEVPIVFTDRVEGESKVSLSEVFRNLRDLIW